MNSIRHKSMLFISNVCIPPHFCWNNTDDVTKMIGIKVQ